MYIEFIIVLNFLLDYLILYGTKRLLKINGPNKRLFLSSIIGSSTIIFLFIKTNSFEMFLIKIIISCLMIIISFGTRNIFRNTLYFYFISIIVGGSVYLLDLNKYKYYFLYLIVLGPIVIYLLIRELISLRITYQDKYVVTIYYKNKKYILEGFIDTGNRLVDSISKKAIILVNLNIKVKEVLYIPYKTLNSEGIIPCIKPDKVLIDNKEYHNYLVGIAKDKFSLNGENCILPNRLKEEICLD